MVFGDIRRVELRQNLYLLLNVLDLIFRTLKIDDFNRDRFLSAFVVAAASE